MCGGCVRFAFPSLYVHYLTPFGIGKAENAARSMWCRKRWLSLGGIQIVHVTDSACSAWSRLLLLPIVPCTCSFENHNAVGTNKANPRVPSPDTDIAQENGLHRRSPASDARGARTL
jgi:hypothetical protein